MPADRKKPWGTGQAVLSVKGLVSEPFAVINADDYYGPEGFRVLHEYMTTKMDLTSDKLDMCMAGFILKNTLSDNGTVTRGACQVSPDGYLTDVTETYGIRMENGILKAEDQDGNPRSVSPDQFVSMNMWGLPPAFLAELEEGFPKFLAALKPGDIKKEYLLPTIINNCIKSGKGSVQVLPTHDKWFGVTYKEDKPVVVESIRKLIADGVYPEKLYG